MTEFMVYRLILLLWFVPTLALGQAKGSLPAYLQEARLGHHPSIPTPLPADSDTRTVWASTVENALAQDTTGQLDYAAFHLLYQLSQGDAGAPLRQAVIHTLVSNLLEGHRLSVNLAEWLRPYAPAELRETTRALIVQYFPGYKGSFYREVAELIGWFRIEELRYAIEDRLPDLSPVDRWYTYAALARLGDEPAALRMHAILDRAGVSADALQELYPTVVYTREPSLIGRLVEIVNTDEHSCAAPYYYQSEPISCAYLAMEFLPDAIKDFPYTQDLSGELEVEDYALALTNIRQWLGEHPNYEIEE